MKPAIRIIVAVLVIFGFFAGLRILTQSVNPVMRNAGDKIITFLLFSFLFIPACFMIYLPFRALRKGTINVRNRTYDRAKNPFRFWFNVFFFGFTGLAIGVSAITCLFS